MTTIFRLTALRLRGIPPKAHGRYQTTPIAALVVVALCLLSVPHAAAQVSTVTVTTINPSIDASGGVVVGPDGNIYVSDFGATLNANGGNTIYLVEPDGSTSVFATGFSGASGNAFDAAGNLYQSNIGGNRVSKVTPDGTVSTYATAGITAPVGAVVDKDGNVYNTNCTSPGFISKTTPAQATSTFSTSSLMNCPNGLTIDNDGNLYTANFSNGNVIKITPDGVASLFATISTTSGNGHLTFANNRLYVCSWVGRIHEVLLDGTSRVLVGSGVAGIDDGPGDIATLHHPNGISASVTGDTLYFNQSALSATGSQLHPNIVRMITGVANTLQANEDMGAVDNFQLLPTAPNPFSASTVVAYTLARTNRVTLRVYDLLGKRVRTLVDGIQTAGSHSVTWDGLTDAGSRVANGIYLTALEDERRRDTRTVVVVR